MAVGPAALWTGRKSRLRPVVKCQQQQQLCAGLCTGAAAARCLILQGIKRCRSNSTREDSQTVSVGIVVKCWCSELYKLMNCQCFLKTKVCHVLKVLRGLEEQRGVKPIMSLADPVTFLKRFLSSFRGDDGPLFLTRNGKLEQNIFW